MNVQKYEKILRDRLRLLSERLEEIDEELDEPNDPDAEDRATENEGDEVLERLGNAGLEESVQIRAALRRIEEGKYGICVACGAPIPEARLDVVPHTENCIDCAQ
jgi:RNA polymerase-binding protein DksA